MSALVAHALGRSDDAERQDGEHGDAAARATSPGLRPARSGAAGAGRRLVSARDEQQDGGREQDVCGERGHQDAPEARVLDRRRNITGLDHHEDRRTRRDSRRRGASAQRARSLPATGNHSITRATQKCSRITISTVKVRPSCWRRVVDPPSSRPPTPLASRTGSSWAAPQRAARGRGTSRSPASAAPAPARAANGKTVRQRFSTAAGAAGRHEKDRVRRLDRRSSSRPRSPRPPSSSSGAALQRAQAEVGGDQQADHAGKSGIATSSPSICGIVSSVYFWW